MSQIALMDGFNVLIRSIVSILALFILTRLMGKKQIAQLTFFDYVVGITIGSIAGEFAINEDIPYTHGIIALIVYAIFPIIEYHIASNNIWIRTILDGSPTVVIQNGKFIEKNMAKSMLHINDVLEECRLNGVFTIADVEYAILETSGKISILLKANKLPVNHEDLQLKTNYSGLAADLIINGIVLTSNLKLINREEKWLLMELEKRNIRSPKEVLLATIDAAGQLYIDLKNHDPIPLEVLK
jgi:uncharacterized membrane protein YcaP (DUF421 family)